jgi:hypothetical protein
VSLKSCYNFLDCVSSHRIPKDCAGGAQSAGNKCGNYQKDEGGDGRTQSTFFIIFDESISQAAFHLCQKQRDESVYFDFISQPSISHPLKLLYSICIVLMKIKQLLTMQKSEKETSLLSVLINRWLCGND